MMNLVGGFPPARGIQLAIIKHTAIYSLLASEAELTDYPRLELLKQTDVNIREKCGAVM